MQGMEESRIGSGAGLVSEEWCYRKFLGGRKDVSEEEMKIRGL